MSVATWRSDVNLLLSWVETDKRVLDRLGKHLRAEERAALEAVVRTKGDPKALVEQLGPIAIARLKARGVSIPERFREPAAKAWKIVRLPLKAAWRPPAAPTPQKLAQAFLEKYNVRLASLTTEAKAADKAVSALTEGLRGFGAAKDLMGLAASLEDRVEGLKAAAKKCTHSHRDAGAWASDTARIAREAAQTRDLVRSLRDGVKAMDKQLVELSRCISEWTQAPPADRAARAESMAVRIEAASDVVASMREDFLALAVGRR